MRQFPAKFLLATAGLIFALLLADPAPAQAQTIPGISETKEAEPPADRAKALVEVLKDDQARQALIEELERLSGAAEPAAEAEPAEESRPQSIGRRIAEATRGFAHGALANVRALWDRLQMAPDQFDGLRGDALAVIAAAAVDLALIIVATVVVFFLLRRVGKRLDSAMGARAADSGLLRTAALIVGSVLIDVAVVLLAWAAGYLLALFVIDGVGVIDIRQTLYLNAFLVVELVKVAVRTVLSPNTAALRPINIPDGAARKLNVWLSVVVSVLGYGQLLVMPIVAENVSWLAGQSMGVLIALIALLLLATLVLTHRRQVADWLLHGKNMSEGPRSLRGLAEAWHVPVMLYLSALFVIVLTRPGGVLLPVLGASGQILAAIILGSIAANAISRSIAKGVVLPASINERLPALERRLNAFVPKALTLVRIAIVLGVVLYSLQTIDLVDIEGWLVSQVGVRLTGMIFSVVFVLLGAFLIWLAISSYIDYRLNPDFGSVPSAREQTLLSLARNALNIVVVAITSMFVLSELGIDIAPLIASAGVIGLAIGFGAQKLVQDIITGIFIQFENAMNVGDVVQVGGTTGMVEKLTIRSVSLRDLHGVFHIIPFSSVDMVSNYMRGFSQYVCDMGVAYREDIDVAKQAMLDAFAELREMEDWKPFILEDMTWFGLQTFGDSAIVLRSRIKTAPGKQWSVGRAYNAILKRIFDERGIEIPFPHQTIYFGEDKDGKAPVAHIAIERDEKNADDKAKEPDKVEEPEKDADAGAPEATKSEADAADRRKGDA